MIFEKGENPVQEPKGLIHALLLDGNGGVVNIGCGNFTAFGTACLLSLQRLSAYLGKHGRKYGAQ